MKRDMDSWVYFVRRGATGAIKIGSSATPEERMATLQVGSDEPLQLVLKVRGGAPLERALHVLCERDVKFGEWFHPTDFVLSVIGLLRLHADAEGFQVDDRLPAPRSRANWRPTFNLPDEPRECRYTHPNGTFDVPGDNDPPCPCGCWPGPAALRTASTR